LRDLRKRRDIRDFRKSINKLDDLYNNLRLSDVEAELCRINDLSNGISDSLNKNTKTAIFKLEISPSIKFSTNSRNICFIRNCSGQCTDKNS